MRIPNVQDLRMRPEYIRYVIIFQTAAGPRLATTYRHAERVYNDNNVEKVWLVDLQEEKVQTFNRAEFSQFLRLWKQNYLNTYWEY